MKFLCGRIAAIETIFTWTNPEQTHEMMKHQLGIEPISAGFVILENGALRCVGRSESLGIGSRPDRDTRLLMASLMATTRIHGND